MQADSNQSAASHSLEKYINLLYSEYSGLLKILELEMQDIEASEERKLSLHTQLETEKVENIANLTSAIRTYSEELYVTEAAARKLSEIGEMKERAYQQSRRNIAALREEMAGVKLKIDSIKLPQSARRVYYSGNNPTLMDIKI